MCYQKIAFLAFFIISSNLVFAAQEPPPTPSPQPSALSPQP